MFLLQRNDKIRAFLRAQVLRQLPGPNIVECPVHNAELRYSGPPYWMITPLPTSRLRIRAPFGSGRLGTTTELPVRGPLSRPAHGLAYSAELSSPA